MARDTRVIEEFLHEAMLAIVWRHWQELYAEVLKERNRDSRLPYAAVFLHRAEARLLECEILLDELMDLASAAGARIPQRIPVVRDEFVLLFEGDESEGQ